MKAARNITSRILAVMLALFLCMGTTTTAFAATFGDLQDAINGNGGADMGDGSYGYAATEHEDGTKSYGITASTSKDDEGNDVRNVTLHEKVEQKSGEDSITIDKGKDVNLDLNGNDIVGNGESNVITVGSATLSDSIGSSLTLTDSAATGSTEDGTYESGKITGGTNGVVTWNQTEFTMNGGTISENDGGLGGGVLTRSEFTMNDGAISNNTVTGNGGGVFVNQVGNFTMNGGEISGNEAANGGGVYVNSSGNEHGKFTMNDGEISGNTATTGNGGGVYTNSEFTMNGGAISGNTATGKKEVVNEKGETEYVDFTHDDYAGTNAPAQGGGVYVTGAKGELNLTGGEISGNTAGEGGGVFINNKSSFEMTGGEVSENVAKFGEGGGIYVWGTGEISGGKIIDNTTETQRDLGGGGIYIESDGKLHLINAIITNNTANGLGGGLAACVHGKTIVYVNDGAIIYENSAAGEADTGEGHKTDKYKDGNGSFIDGHNWWENDETFKKGAQDIFTASDKGEKNNSGTPGIIVSNTTLFGDANWTGYLFLYDENTGNLMTDEDGNPIWTEVTKDSEGGFVYGNRLLGLKANPSDDTIAAAKAAAEEAAAQHVIISGNHSYTHGGGIANNGTLTIGNESPFEDDDTPDEVEGTKEFEKVEDAPENSEDRDLADGEFTFALTDAEDNTYKGTNDAAGNIVIELPEDYFTNLLKDKEDGTYTFTFKVSEENNGDESVTFDEGEYEVTITIVKETKTDKITIGDGEQEFQTVKFTAESVTYTKDGETVDGITFTNKYTPTVTPSGGGDQTITPGNDPEPKNPENPPENPPEDPEEDVEIPDEEIPLAELPDEEIELDDPEIPLSDVPQTGDISLVWYAAAGMSALGLVALGLTKKREGEEA